MNTRVYSQRYDAYYNPVNNAWLDSPCDDPECLFCVDRPSVPSDVKDHVRELPSTLNM